MVSKTRLVDPYPKFLPRWTKALKDAFKRDKNWASLNYIQKEHGLDYGEFTCCLIGEADLFNETFKLVDSCHDCHHKFGHAISEYRIDISLKNFYKYKRALVAHLKKSHKNAAKHWGLIKG